MKCLYLRNYVYMTTLLLSDYMTVNDFSRYNDKMRAPNMQENMLLLLNKVTNIDSVKK